MFQGFQADVDPNAAAAREEALSGGDGTFPPILGGKYQVELVPLKADGTPFEVVDFGGNGANAHKKMVRIAVKVVADSPSAKGRVFFVRVPLFSRYAPNEKNPNGAPARMYFDFWEKALGLDEGTVLSGQLPALQPYFGRRFTATISAPQQPRDDRDLQYNPLGTNEVSFFDKAGDVSATPVLQPGQAVAPWLTPEGTVIPGFQFDYQKAQQKAAAAAGGAPAPSFGQSAPAPSFGQQQAPAPSFGQQPAQQTPANVHQFPQPPQPQWAGQQQGGGLAAAAAGAGTSF